MYLPFFCTYIITYFRSKVNRQNNQSFIVKFVHLAQKCKNRRATTLGATAKRNPPRGRCRRCHHPQSGEELCSYEGGYTLPAKTLLPIMPQAQVIGRGLWRATLRPDIEHKPSEWGRVVVVRPCATNRGRLLAVAKLDGVCDYPNCRSRGSGQP